MDSHGRPGRLCPLIAVHLAPPWIWEVAVQVGLNLNPLVPLFPFQPDRQPVYSKALGPVFVGSPYLKFPEGKPKTADTAPSSSPLPMDAQALMKASTEYPAAIPRPILPKEASGFSAFGLKLGSTPLGSQLDLIA